MNLTIHSGTQSAKTTLLAIIVVILTGCSSSPFQPGDGAPNVYVDVDAIPNPVPRHEPISKYGNPDTYEVFGKHYKTLKSSQGFIEQGIASWYGTKFHGRRTSSGEGYNMYAMTAAHKNLPLPTYVEVTHLDNGHQLIVKVNDRGPFHDGRIIDLSYAAAIKLGINKTGTGRVEIRAIDPSNPVAHRNPPSTADVSVQALAPSTSANNAVARHIYLQIGAFSSKTNAENLRNRLTNMANHPIHILPGDNPTLPVFRVRIGPLPSDQAAQRLAFKLIDKGITNTSVVID